VHAVNPECQCAHFIVKLAGSLGFVISDFRKLTWTFVVILDIMIAAVLLFDSSAKGSDQRPEIDSFGLAFCGNGGHPGFALLAHLKQSSSVSCEIQPVFGDLFAYVNVAK
jgi:hypothetical protein